MPTGHGDWIRYIFAIDKRTMYTQPELNELAEAIKLSPENVTLRFLLIKKLQFYPEYRQQLEDNLNALLQYSPQHSDAKEILAKLYFDKGKVSAAIIIAEELLQDNNLSLEGQIILAKSYLAEEDTFRARELYQKVLTQDPDMSDPTLDNEFRVKVDGPGVEEILAQSMFLEKPKINFSDVGGLDHVKKEIDLKIIKPLEHAELYAQYGKKVGGGILLYGPPGCGKTYLAKATAGEINAGFINVGLNDILDMYIGNSEKNLHAYFEEARANKPCVLFFDEIDALGAKRTDLRQSAGKNVINQFLAELDGIESDNEGVLIIGATNSPWHIDSAFRRPGRFDRIIFVPPPDVESKEEILKIALREKPNDSIDYKKVSKTLADYSGADINALVDIATESKLVEAMETGVPQPIRTKDLLAASKHHKASTIDWFTTAKNYAMFANQSGLYDSILAYLDKK